MVPKQAVLKVEGLSCDMCARTVREALERAEGVFTAVVSLEDGEATVTYDASVLPESALVESVREVGYESELTEGHVSRSRW